MMVLKQENAMKNDSTDFKWEKSKECLHKTNASCIILSKKNTIQRRNKRADSKSGISPNGRIYCSVKAENYKAFSDCTEVFPQQAREILLTLSDGRRLSNLGEGL